MSHRKFSAPRSGSLAFLPRKRSKRHRGKIKSFPLENKSDIPHLTAFIGYKAGMTHILREMNKIGSKTHKKEIVEAVTIIETPPIVAIGFVGYQKTLYGLKAIGTIWATCFSDSFLRRHYKNWTKSKKKAFSNTKNKTDKERKIIKDLIIKHCDIVRLICHTEIGLLNIRQKKSHIMEIQINGGDIIEKTKFCFDKLENKININSVFNENDICDTIAITKGKGTKGVISRWGVTRLPRKTHRGLRKVACIGPWHPARVSYSVARVGQKGYHHRTEKNKQIYLIGKGSFNYNAKTKYDLTNKNITPMGGFVKYGEISEDFIIIKGSCPGVIKRPITIRKCLQKSKKKYEKITIKWIDTSSKIGHGRFQTKKEKLEWFGPMKKNC